MSLIYFSTKISKIGSTPIIHLPKNASAQLPSRGIVMVKGTINNFPFQSELEPDGKGSHWFKIDKALLDGVHPGVGDIVELSLESTKDWPEPQVPEDIKKTITADAKAFALWEKITPMARWDWIRWIGSTKNPDTYKNQIVVAISKLKKGERR